MTQKQERFVQELIKGKSQREAYKSVYKPKSMLDKSIDEQASRLFNQVKVNARYKDLKQKVLEESEKEAIISAKAIISELASIALADIGDYLTYKTVKVVAAHDEDGDPVFEYRPVIEFKDSKEVNTSLISEISLTSKGLLKIKMHDKISALNKLAEIMGLNLISLEKLDLSRERLEEDKKRNTYKNW